MFLKTLTIYVDSKGQMSVDLLIAVAVMVLAITTASYYVISAFAPYSGRDIDLQASAYRVAMILSEDGGLWVSSEKPRLLESDWAQKIIEYKYNINKIKICLKRIGLANTSTTYLIKLSYEVQIPCYLNETKVLTFFNRTLWTDLFEKDKPSNYPYNYTLDKIADLIGLNSSIRHYYYNVSLRYMNGTVVDSSIGKLWIGYPLYVKGEFVPKEFGKFERIVVLDNNKNVSAPKYDPSDPSKCFLRLVVYVW